MSKEINTRIVHKHDLEKNWDLASNFIPKNGEIIIYDAEQSVDDLPSSRAELIDYVRIKIGDGVTTVSQLSFTLDVWGTELITVEEIDAICGTTIQNTSASEITF